MKNARRLAFTAVNDEIVLQNLTALPRRQPAASERNGYSSEEIERLTQAFNSALRGLHLVDRNDPICEIVARKVIEIDKADTHDPREIAAKAVKQLGP